MVYRSTLVRKILWHCTKLIGQEHYSRSTRRLHITVWYDNSQLIQTIAKTFEALQRSPHGLRHGACFTACTWWRHQMEAFSALLAICAGNSPVPGEFPIQRPVTRSFDVFFDLRPNKPLSKQWWGWWFETPSCPLWHPRNESSKQLQKRIYVFACYMIYAHRYVTCCWKSRLHYTRSFISFRHCHCYWRCSKSHIYWLILAE